MGLLFLVTPKVLVNRDHVLCFSHSPILVALHTQSIIIMIKIIIVVTNIYKALSTNVMHFY